MIDRDIFGRTTTKDIHRKKIHNLPEIFKVLTSFVSVSSKEKEHVDWIKARR